MCLVGEQGTIKRLQLPAAQHWTRMETPHQPLKAFVIKTCLVRLLKVIKM